MKLELFPQSKSKPVLLLYDGTPEEVTVLQAAVGRLSKEGDEQIAVLMLPGVEPVGGCELFVGVSQTNEGIRKLPNNRFEWRLTQERWGDIAEMVEGFKKPWRAGHAFLD